MRCGCLNVYRAASFKKVVGWRKAWGIAKKKRAVLGRSEKNAEKKAKAYNIDNRKLRHRLKTMAEFSNCAVSGSESITMEAF